MTEPESRSGPENRFPQRAAISAAVLMAATITSFAAMSSPAQSTPDHLSGFNKNYGTSGTRLDSCMTCHTSSPGNATNVNPYGADFASNNHDFGAVEPLDSDGDGFTNIDEINALTFPGDPADNPNTKPEPKPAPSTTTTTQGLIPGLPTLP